MSDQPQLLKVSNGKVIAVSEGMIVGRQSDCTLQLTEGHASRKHAKLGLSSAGPWVEDMGSANGTFVNGARIEGRVQLRSGDRVRFDVEEFDVRLPVPPAVDEEKTMFRAAEPAAVEAASSGLYKRPGAWADPDALGDESSKTKFIDPAQLKQMIVDSPSTNTPSATPSATLHGPHLQVVSGNRAGLNIRLTVGAAGTTEWTVGSQADREVQLSDSGVSALHAKIVNEGERWKLLDQMSANGTYVNGKRSNVSYLSSGDRVRFGPVECVFHASTAPAQRVVAESADEPPAMNKTWRIAGAAFAATLLVLVVLYAVL